MRLFAHLFDNSLTSPSHIMGLDHKISNIVLTWELHGGLKSIELEWSAGLVDAYQFYTERLGDRIIILDHFCDMPVADGFVTGVKLTPRGVSIIASGMWFRHYDSLYNFDTTIQDFNQGALSYTDEGGAETFTDAGQDDFSEWETTSGDAQYEITVINDDNTVSWGFLGASVSATEIRVYQDFALTTAGWNGVEITDKTPDEYEIILCYDYKTTTEILLDALDNNVSVISSDLDEIDETDTVIGFWEPNIEEGGMYPGELIEKLASMSDSTYTQWNYWLENQPLRNVSPVLPRAHFEAQLDDGTFDWKVHRRMIRGDSATAERNIQELRNAVKAIYRDMEDDQLKVEPDDGSWVTDADSISDFWRREIMVNAGNSDIDLAGQYGDLYLDKYRDAMFNKAFIIGSREIEDSFGITWPLWAPIKFSKSYFKFLDLFPLYKSFDTSWDRTLSSQATVMEYNYENNTLRVVLDQEDDRLDAMLARISAFQ
jgi:hypothetical protein